MVKKKTPEGVEVLEGVKIIIEGNFICPTFQDFACATVL